MNEAQLAQLTLEFLKKTPMVGADMAAFVQVNNWLNGKMQQQEEEKSDDG